VRERRDNRVGNEDTRKCTDKSRADQAAEDLRRLVDRAHRLDDAKHRRDDTERGEGLGDDRHCVIGLHARAGEGLDLLIHQRFDFMRPRIADDDETEIIADEVAEFLVFRDLRKALEYFRAVRLLDVLFDFVSALAAKLAHQGVQHFQEIQIILSSGNGGRERFDDGRAGVFHRRHGIADEERTDGGSDDDDEFPGLPENADMAAQSGIAAEDRSERDDETDEDAQEPGSFGLLDYLQT
jgi:hypothetical protein